MREQGGPALLDGGIARFAEALQRGAVVHGDEITGACPDFETPARTLRALLSSPELAYKASENQRRRALDLFDVAKVGQQWREFLG